MDVRNSLDSFKLEYQEYETQKFTNMGVAKFLPLVRRWRDNLTDFFRAAWNVIT